MKSIAIVREIESVASARSASRGQQHHNAAVYVSIEEEGFSGGNLVYCRYGLSIPFYKVQVGEKLLVEPTNGYDERWFYVGLADATGISPTEPFILGNQIKTYLDNLQGQINSIVSTINANNVIYLAHTHPTAVPGPPSHPASGFSNASNVDAPTNAIKSDKIYGK